MSINNVSNVSDALKYVSGMEVSETERSIVSDVKDSIFNPITLAFGALEVNSSLKSNLDAKSIKDVFEKIKTVGEVEKGSKIGTAIRSTNIGEQWTNTVSNVIKKADDKIAEKAAKAAAKSTASEVAETALTTTTKEAAEATSKGILSTIKSGFSKVGSAISSVVSKVGSAISSVVSKIPGVSKLKEGLSWLSKTKVGKIAKGTGAVGMMAFEGIIGLVTEVIPAFAQGGFDSGMKQLGKTAIKTASTGIGWAAGTMGATALGAAIGSIFPGVGTVIGGAIGTFIGGMLGSTVCNGITSKIVGKSEVEILQDEQFEEAASQVANDTNAMNELNQMVAAQVQADIANGTVDEDTEKMAALLNSGAFTTTSAATNPYTVTNLQTTTPATNTTTTTTTQTNTSPANSSYWTAMAEKAACGETSIYNISDEKLDSVFSNPNTNGISTDTSLSKEATNENVNYFAVG